MSFDEIVRVKDSNLDGETIKEEENDDSRYYEKSQEELVESTLVEFHSHLLAETKETELRKGDASPPLRDKSRASSPAGELQDDAECRELSKSFCEEALQEQINSLSNRPNDAANLKALGKVYVHGAKHRANEKRSGNSLKREKSYKLVDPGLNEILSKVKPYKQNHLLDSTARTSKEQNKKSFKEVLQIPPVISPGFPASPSQPTGSKILYTHPAKNHAHPPPGARKEEPPSCTGLNHLLDVRDRNLSLEPPKKKERSLSEKVKKSEKGLPLVGIEGGQPKQEYMVKSGSEVRKSGNGEVAGKKPRGVKADTTPDTSFQTNSKTGKEIARPEYKKPNVYDSSDYFTNVGYKKLINKLEKPRESNLDRIISHTTVSNLSSKVKKKK